MTEQDLKNFRQLKKEVELLQNQILKLERIKAVAKVTKPKTSFPSGFKNTADENLIKLESAKINLNEQLNIYLAKIEEVEEFINGLKTSLERNIFRTRYVEGLGWEHVAVRAEKTTRQVQRIHDKCLGYIWVKDENGKIQKVLECVGNVV